MKKNRIKLNRIIFVIISILFMSISLLNILYAAPLKKGIYEIKNHRKGGSMYVDETGKIILKSEPKVEISAIRDLFTDEIGMLLKRYEKLYEDSSVNYHINEYGNEEYERIYTELIPARTEYYDLYGNKINLDRDVIAIVNENVILSNGQVVNMLLNAKYKLKEVKNESPNIVYSANAFDDKVLISEKERIYNDKSVICDSKWVLYLYDKNLNFLKKFDDYVAYGEYSSKDGQKRISLSHLTKAGIDEYGNFSEDTEQKFLNEDLEIESYDRSINDLLKFETDIENLEATVLDGEKKVKLNDIDIKSCKRIVMGKDTYYYVHTETGSFHYIYNDKGSRVKVFNDATSEPYKVIYSDDVCVAMMNGIDKSTVVLDKNFSTVQVFYPTSSNKNNVTISRIFGGKYYLVNNESVYNTNFKVEFKPSSTCKVLFDKYLFETGVKSKVLDSNLKEIKKFNRIIKSVETIDMNGKIFYEISSKDFTSILDSNFNEILLFEKNKVDIFRQGLTDYFLDGISYKYDGSSRHILFFYDKKVNIVNLDFKKVEEFEIEDDQYISGCFTADNGEDYISFHRDYENDYSLYKVGTGYVLKNFYFIGDMKKDHFTFANGFYYGLMDYDLNILCQYSIFDKMDEDNTPYDWNEWYP